jgi:cytochrome c oxidase assembly protein subunit 15
MEAATSRLARLRAFELSPRRYAQLTYGTVFVLWMIVSTGAVVRLTGSGLGCESWPGCEEGRPFPEKDYHAFIEFGNRLVGGITIAVTLALAAAAWFVRDLPRWARWLAVATCAGTIAQAPLGAIAVYTHLHPLAVAPHLVLSIAVLGAAVVVAIETLTLVRGRTQPLAREARYVGVAIATACFVLVVSGTIATAAGPHSGGENVTRVGSLGAALIAHGATVAVFGLGLMFLLGYLFARRRETKSFLVATAALSVLVLVQMALGDIQYRTHLPWWLVLVHVAVAATVWTATVALVTAMWRPPRTLAR